MSAPVEVDDPGDPRLADYIGLKDADLRRAVEEPGAGGQGIFIAEGELVVRRLLGSGFGVRSVLVTPKGLAALGALLDGVAHPVYVANQAVMNAVAGFNIHRGVLASALRGPAVDPAALVASARRVAVTEAVTDHENLGGIFRNAAAFGLDAVLLSPECCDPFYRRCIRVSIGHVLSVPSARLAAWPGGIGWLRAEGFYVVALTPGAGAADIRSLGLGARDRVAFLLGTEGPGLSAAALSAADAAVRIPIAAGVDSLNVASAAAVAFYEGSRPGS
ncbi:MAG TPA: RNA methyltransferase [Actinomycetota bacterium]|nr:RNA methyltransferase [Actinomycetota bacterium]